MIDPRFGANPTLPGVGDPFLIFRAVREADPVHFCQGANLWAVMRYDDAETVLKDPHLSRQAYLDVLEARAGKQPITQMQRHELVFTDNPVHGKLKHIINETINAHVIHDMETRIDKLVEDKLRPLLSRGEMDLIADFLSTFPTSVAAIWLGVPEEDRQRIVNWIFPLVSGRGVARNAATAAAASKAAVEFRRYFDELLAQRRARPTGDLLSGLLAAQREAPELLIDDVLFALIVAVFGGGHTPGIAMVACTMLALMEFPQELERLKADPSLLPSAVEEGLRFTSPTMAPNPLAATEDFELRGKRIRKGDALTVILASANRDPVVFDDPDRFDVGRSPNRHLAFSLGWHYCLGSELSRVEARSALRALTSRLADVRLACDLSELKWIPHDRFRVLEAMPISFRAV